MLRRIPPTSKVPRASLRGSILGSHMPFLTEEEVQYFLHVNPPDMQRLIKKGKLTAYRVGGSYLRFKKEEVLAIKNGVKFSPPEELGRSSFDRVRDFWKFYNFYIISLVLVLLLTILFFQL